MKSMAPLDKKPLLARANGMHGNHSKIEVI
jgi:hypothetical protein